MKKRKVLISALLAAAIVSTATLTSCGDKKEEKKTTTSAQGGDTTTPGGDTTTPGGDTTTSTTTQGGGTTTSTTTQGGGTTTSTTTQGGGTTTSTTTQGGGTTTSTTTQGGGTTTSTTTPGGDTTTSTDTVTSTTEEVVENKATLELHYNGADLDEVSESIEIELTEDDGDGVKYAEIPQDKITVRDTYRKFAGWYKDKGFTQPASTDELQYIEANTTLYAKWEAEGKMTDFELNASTDLSSGLLASDYKKGIYTVKAGANMRSATYSGDYATGYTQEIQGNGNMQVYISPLANTTLSIIFAQRSGSSISTAGLFEVVDDVVSETSIYTLSCGTNGTKWADKTTGKAEIALEGGKTYLLKGTGGTCSILDMFCQYEVTPSPVDNIEIITAKTINLIEGEQYDSATAGAKINFENGTSQDMAAGQFEIDYSQVDTTKEGIYTVQVKYSPEEYIYNKLKGKTYTADITVKVFSIKEIVLGFNQTVSGKSSYNGTLENRTVKTIYKAGEEFDRNYLSVTAHATLGEGDEVEEYTKLLSANEYLVDMVGETVSSSGEVTVQYTTNEQVKEATYNIYVVNALDVTQATYNVKVDDDYTGAIGAVSSGVYQFKTINQAMEFLRLYKATANYEEKAINLTIAAGYYNEKVEFDLPNMTVKGAGRVNKAINTGFDWTDAEIQASTIIEWNSIKGVVDESGYVQQTDSTATVSVRETAVNFYISGVTISNDFNSFQDFIDYFGDRPNETQALALLVQSDKFVMYQCDLLGYQDTLETFTGRQVFMDSLISGTTDFIFGTNSATYFYGCEIRCISPAQLKDGYVQYNVDGGYVTAYKGNNKDADDAIEYGAVFDACDFTAEKYVRNIDGYTAQIKLEDKSYAEYEVAAGGKYYTRVDTTKVEAPVAGTTYYTFTVTDGLATFTPAGEITAWAENTQYATAEDITTGNTAIARPWGVYASIIVENSTLGGHISLLDYDLSYKETASPKTKDVLTTAYSYFEKVDQSKTTAPASGTKYYTIVEGVFTEATGITAWAADTDYYTLGGTKKVGNDVKAEHYYATLADNVYTYVANPDKKAVTNDTYYKLVDGVYTTIAKGTDYDSSLTYYAGSDPKDSKNRRYVTMSGNSPMTSTIKFSEYNNTGSGAGTVKSIDDTHAYKVNSSAITQDAMFYLENGKVSFYDRWLGAYTSGAPKGKVVSKNANLILNLVGENNSYYADAKVTSAFTANTQYYVLDGDTYTAIDVNKYAFKDGVTYYYDKTVYNPVAPASIKLKAKLNDNYHYFTKADTSKAPVEGTTYYTIVENIFTVTAVTEWVEGTTYYVYGGTRKVGEDVKPGTNFHATYDEATTTYTYVETPAQYDVLNEQYYNEDGSIAYEKGKEPYDSTKTYYSKGTAKAAVEDQTQLADKTIKYYSFDGVETYTELAFNSTNFTVTLDTPEAGVTYYVASGVITLSKAYYSNYALTELELNRFFDDYKANNPSLADFSILGVYANADMSTEYTYPALSNNNNTIYLEVGLPAFLDFYTYDASAATNPDWTISTSDSATKMFIPYAIGGTVVKNGTGNNGVACTVIKNNGEDCVTSKTFAVGARAVNVTIVGGTTDSGDARFKVVAYNSANEAIASVQALNVEGSNAKTTTHFFADADAKDSKGNKTVAIALDKDVETDIAYVKVFACHKDGTQTNGKVNGILSIDMEVLYETTAMIGKKYTIDIDRPNPAEPWKKADNTMVALVQGFTATSVDGLVTIDATAANAKLNSRASQWAEFNYGAKVIFNVNAGATVTLNVYQANTTTYSINGATPVVVNATTVSFKVTHASTIEVAANADGKAYLGDFTVTFE